MSIDDYINLVREGKHAEAQEMMKTLKAKAKNEPDLFIQETGKPGVAKRRGKIVEQDEDGNRKPKSPLKRKKKGPR